MEFLDSYCAVIGLVAVGMGIYELITKKLVGRKVEKVPKEDILRFLPYDAATYIIIGLLLALQGLNQYFPLMGNGYVVLVTSVLTVVIIYFNWRLSRKFLGVQPGQQHERLK